MRAIRLQALHQIALSDQPHPEPGPGEAVVRVLAAGICGTDRHLYAGEFPSRPPVTLGHEFAGTVTATGPGVTLPLGTLIACNPNIACTHCPECRAGRVNLCRNNIAIGISRDGGFAEYVAMPVGQAHVMPPGLSPLHAAFCEPLACTLHGLDLGAPVAGERVIVLGGGVIGLLAQQLAQLAGAEVMMVTRQADKRRLAESLGASCTAASAEQALSLWPEGASLVIECAGVAETMAAAPRLTAPGGRVVILGVLPKGQTVAFEPFDLLFREIRILPAFINPFTQSRAASLIAGGKLALDPLISRQIPLADAAAAIAAPARPGEVKVMVLPQE
jgi:L-iditol 2-dehydrogenase